jgi:hypothetical protein
MMKPIFASLMVCPLSVVMLLNQVKAADREMPRRAVANGARPLYCGCGCLYVSFDRHRELHTTYGTNFDPRNFDQTEPHYYFGRMRAYRRFCTDRYGVESQY